LDILCRRTAPVRCQRER